jgi:hypothetical protein
VLGKTNLEERRRGAGEVLSFRGLLVEVSLALVGLPPRLDLNIPKFIGSGKRKFHIREPLWIFSHIAGSAAAGSLWVNLGEDTVFH